VREPLLDVLAHLHGALVQERFAVVEEVDPDQRGASLVDRPSEQIEVEHAGLAGAGDAGFRRAARLLAGDVARRGGLDIEPGGELQHVQVPYRGGLILLQRQLQGAVAAELRAAGIEVLTEP
jgi:hypothetical protein